MWCWTFSPASPCSLPIRKPCPERSRRERRIKIITTIFKFSEADGTLNPRNNIIALVDEAHRTQEGDLGRKMRDALPNAFLFGLDALRDRFENGVLNSVEFLKQLLQIAKEVLLAEKETPPEEEEDRGKSALTELFNEVKNADTPIIVERVVADIDEIVRLVRFSGWQNTLAGEREVKKALRKSLFKYKLHADEELFDKAYSHIRQYY